MKRIIHILASALLASVISACGGGGGGSSVADGGIGGTGISSGSISAIGSIVVNGTTFDIESAEITVNGDDAMRSALKVGYVVRVDGDLDEGVSDTVRFEADLIGEVDGNTIPPGESVGTLRVLQQTVVITARTVLNGFDSPDRDTIAAGDRVLVSGFRDSQGRLVATHLELAPAETDDQIVGRVTSSGSTSFQINGLKINSNSGPDEGDRVLVRGNYNPDSDQFNADAPIEELPDLVEAGTDIELEGIVDRFAGESDFDVNGITVDASNARIVDESGTETTFRKDAEIEVEGTFDASGTLIADRVEVELEDNVEVVARVANTPQAGGPVEFFHDGSNFNLTVDVTDKTRLRDKRDTNRVENFSVADLIAGDWVELDAFEDGEGKVTALKIERFTPDDDEMIELEGLVDSENDPFIEVLGMTFDTAGLEFDFDTIEPGHTVKMEWDPLTSFVQPMPIEDIENED